MITRARRLLKPPLGVVMDQIAMSAAFVGPLPAHGSFILWRDSLAETDDQIPESSPEGQKEPEGPASQ